MPSPEEALAHEYTWQEQASVRERRQLLIEGTPEKVRAQIEQMVAETEADEVMVSSMIHDPAREAALLWAAGGGVRDEVMPQELRAAWKGRRAAVKNHPRERPRFRRFLRF